MNPGARLGWILVCCTYALVKGATPLATDPNPLPDLLPVEILSVTQSLAGAQIAVDYALTNQGSGPASADWYDRLYLSADAILDASDYSLGTWLEEEDLAAGASYRRGRSVVLPAAVGGMHYLILWTDSGDTVFESNELNNRSLVQQLEIIAPDLVPVAMEVRGGDGGQAIEVSVTVTNQGSWNAVSQGAVWNDGLFISTNGVWDTTDTLLRLELVAEVVLAGTSYRRTSTVTLPAWVGNFYLIYKADFHGNVIENNETNNELAIAITPRFPDLRPLALTAPSTAVGGRHLTTVMLLTNEGNASATSPYGSWSDGVYLSTDAVLDAQDLQISHPTSTQLVPTNTSYFVTNIMFLPSETGVFYLIGQADHQGRVTELDETDNQLAVPITIVVPDLVATAISGPPPTAVPRQSIQLSYSVTNQGNALANPDWYDQVVFSDDPVWDWWDRRLDSSVREVGLDPGGGYRATNTVTIPAPINLGLPTYYLIVRVNAGGALAEQNGENNSLVWPLEMKFSDLAPIQLIAPAAVVAATPVQVIYAVTNRGNGMAIGPWYDSFFLSTNNVWDPADRLLTSWFLNMDVPANARYAITNNLFFPPWPIGEYYLFLRTDSYDELWEGEELNNISSAIPISLVLPPRLPDLVPIALTAPSQGEVGTQINVSWTVANTGDEPTQLPWEDGLYLSGNNLIWDEDDIFLTGWTNYQPLVVDASNVVSRSVLLPRLTAGRYSLILRVDQTAFISETNEQNNQRSVTINLTPDLSVPSLEIHRQESSVLISWPSALLGRELQSTEDLHSSTQWTVVTNEAVLIGNRFVVTMQAEDTSRFFRLSAHLP